MYNGPMDLLLYLIRRDEIDIYDIPIARLTEQYISYVELIQRLDPNLAGEFLLLAATLIEIKTRMLLPPAQDQQQPGDLTIDPRAELVRRLLEYKVFKDAAGDLEQAAREQAGKFPRRPADIQDQNELQFDLEDVQLWDLVDAFSRIMEAIGHRPGHHEVIYDDTPVELYAADIVDRLQREGALSFESIFEGRQHRHEIVGLFLAMLELIRRRQIRACQQGNFGRIMLRLQQTDSPTEQVQDDTPPPAVGPLPSTQHTSQAELTARQGDMGLFVSDVTPAQKEDNDDDKPEA